MEKKIIVFFLITHFISKCAFAQYNIKLKKDSFPQIERGSLLLNNSYPKNLDSFIVNGFVNLNYVRSVCSFLTDNDVVKYNSHEIPKRNKAFIRHIKHINEIIEQDFLNNKLVDSATVELFFELALLDESLKQKTLANSKINLRTKIEMKLHSMKSSRVFRYKECTTNNEAKNISLQNPLNDPNDSPFWHKQTSNVSLVKRFDQLAKLKKIKVKKEMVVFFDKSSLSGSAPKINVLDIDLTNNWSLKWGDEVHTDIVGSHIFAALGYDVDHSYYFAKNKLTLIFDGTKEIKSVDELKQQLLKVFDVDITPFISEVGIVTTEMVNNNKELKQYIGKPYVRFKKCAIEARPDRVKRIGSFVPNKLYNDDRRELRGALLAHQFIGNWDTKESNTLLTTVHLGNYKYRTSAVFSDLGTSFGVVQNTFPPDFKVGLVNEFPWEVAIKKGNTIKLNNDINSILKCYSNATYNDLKWMAIKIAKIDSLTLWTFVEKGNWPNPIAQLYFHKLASRRASILKAFNVHDDNPIPFDKHLNISIEGCNVINDGKLVVDFDINNNPESFFSKKGRMRNYGH